MFVHLRLHTEFSVVDSTCRIDDVIAAAARDGQVALAITDISNLFGALKFYKQARGKGIKPILGADVVLEGLGGDATALTRMVLLVQNKQGYLNLSELLARAFTQNVVKNQAVVKLAWLRELGEGLIALSGAQAGAVGQALVQGDAARAADLALQMASIFPHRFYLELQRAGRAEDEPHVAACVRLAARLQLPVVASHPVQFVEADDFEAHEARVCIAEGEMLANPKRVRRFTREQYFKPQAEMQALFADIPSAITNTVEIAKRCSLTLVLGKPQLPNFPIPQVDGKDLSTEEYFRYASFEGLKERMAHLYPDAVEREKRMPEYVARLEFELGTILKMGFPGYFLIVGDFINWAKNNGCPVGPGRGSGAGSLVAYALKITDLDPIRYKLLFERFLNPERVSMPDFDIDFCQSNRNLVIDYVKDKYGKDAVSQIATFGTMAARGVVRDVGRVLDMSYTFCDGISKLIPNKPGTNVTLQLPPPDKKSDKYIYATEAEPELARREAEEEDVKTLLELARKLEGLTRNIGMHAGGVLIAPGKLTDFCPLYQQPGSDSAVSQYDKDDVEAIGLVKFDFLGLATLTILEIAAEFIRKRHAGQEKFAYENLPLDDRKVYQLFSEGKTEAVFQFESTGMQRMLKDAKPSRLEDLIALNALYRPGPMDLIPSFVARKHGKEEVEYPHPAVAEMLSETYGIMVYQEQVMQTAQILGGYSLGGADLLRRAMGKKKKEEMDQHRDIFRAGALKTHGIPQEKADEIFDLMEKFAGYGFNKSHAAAYSLLAYHTAWIKVHYTAEFFCANMTVEMDNTDKLKVLFEDAEKMGLTFEPPNINRGMYRFEPISNKEIRYGLGAVKGTGQQAIEAIVAAREGKGPTGEAGPFKSLFDFARRVDRTRLNKRCVEALIKAGAFDTLQLNRAALVASIDRAFDFAAAAAANANQHGLFDMGGDDDHGSSTQEPDMVDALPWGVKERLMQEKTALGFYLSGHLFDEVEREVRRFAKRPIEELLDSREPQLVAGIISDFRVINGERGRRGVFKLDDKSAAIEATVDEELLNTQKALLHDDALVIVSGKYQPARGGFEARFNVKEIWDLTAARCRFGRYLKVAVDTSGGTRAPDVAALLREFPAQREASEFGDLVRGLGVRLAVRQQLPEPVVIADDADPLQAASAELHLGEAVRFYPTDTALASWRAQAHQGQAVVVYE
ncbi:MAG: DNA polymerase III subunit alpha [Rhodoferax sp.]